MQPQSKQVPPRRSFASIRAAFRPYCEARIAQVYPAGPPPSTTTSKIVSAKGKLHVQEATQTILFDSSAGFWIPCRKDSFGLIRWPADGVEASVTATREHYLRRTIASINATAILLV